MSDMSQTPVPVNPVLRISQYYLIRDLNPCCVAIRIVLKIQPVFQCGDPLGDRYSPLDIESGKDVSRIIVKKCFSFS